MVQYLLDYNKSETFKMDRGHFEFKMSYLRYYNVIQIRYIVKICVYRKMIRCEKFLICKMEKSIYRESFLEKKNVKPKVTKDVFQTDAY